ncbi:P-type DNA transfer protein VirB5 [Burkholderia cenocepacia]|uniref:P-type DNA transfer protein VirB5 n=1 Tax=Burkholderia cenocepacia TaxID=95486 RepID=A0A1V2VS28_9BURK|nr:P-type DNA transfer protein VirB5 [Burkholderia cenocepacia]MBR8285437.1 P-type DNA transfer protein VirB5 [Burkholderia cenocepacia]MBR8500964.1 P-type DNA transfer protein VirB5 [Burkholderia cenocepacia]MDR8046047.1 P-type DNA transfer protein VirB5 [Burkholderia cenocepacia]ONI98680.1 P-type DNA transfer protein VirB5 [Burkholderia cenocepacia]ONJ21262.1 P-type DNA transfer protein VirB5 [Burkholderia cenocepacia]
MKRYLFTHIVLLTAVVTAAASFIEPVNAEIYSVYDEKNVAQAIAMVGQLKQQVQQEMALYRSLSGARGFGALLDRPGVVNALPDNWQSVYAAIREGGYAGLTGPAQALRAQSKLYDCEDQQGIDQQICQRALNKPFQDKALGLQAYQTELAELDRIELLMRHIDTTRDPKGIAELQARIQSESVAVGNEMTKLQMFKMLADTEDRLIAEQQTELLLKRAGNTRRLQDQMAPVTFGR